MTEIGDDAARTFALGFDHRPLPRLEPTLRAYWKPTTPTVIGALVLGLVATLTVAAGSAIGAGRAPAVVKACASKGDGTLRLVAKGTSCRKNERSVAWNKRGVPGADGVDGTSGSDGAAGARGPAGVSGYEVVEKSTPLGGGYFFANAFLACPAGKKVIGGGVAALTADGSETSSGAFLVRNQWPSLDGTTWNATVESNNSGSITRYVIRAICASTTG